MRDLLRPSSLVPVILALFAGAFSGCTKSSSDAPSGVLFDVQPRVAVRGRQAAQTVEIRGDGTRWATDGLVADDVSFGPGVVITRLAVANDQVLEVDIQVMADAELGYRDVVVQESQFAGLFRIAEPFEIVAGSPMVAGRIFKVLVEGVGTEWIEGLDVTTTSENLVLEGQWLSLGTDVLGAEVLAPNFLELTGYVHWYAFNGTGGTMDLKIGYGPEEQHDVGVGAIEVEARARKPLVANVAVQDVLEEPYATHVYETEIPAFADCRIFINSTSTVTGYDDTHYELYNAAIPERPWTDFDPASYYYYSDYTFAAYPMYIVVHDELLRGGEDFTYALELSCLDYAPTPLAAGTAFDGGEVAMNSPDDAEWYLIAPARWHTSTITATPSGTMDAKIWFQTEGGLNQLPDLVTEDNAGGGGAESLVAFTGMRRALVGVGDYYDAFGPGTEYTVLLTETPMPGAAVYEALTQVEIPDDGTVVMSPITIAGAGTGVTAVHVAVDLSHEYLYDVTVELVNPQGQAVQLERYRYEPDLVTLYPDLETPDGGTVALDALVAGGDPNGTWTLRIADGYAGESGVLNGWAISFE